MQHPKLVLALDIGTTWAKAGYVDGTGSLAASGRSYVRGGPPFGHNRRDLDEIWRGCVKAVRQATRRLPDGHSVDQTQAIALSAHKAPGIWLDANGQPIDVPRKSIRSAGREAIEECYASDVWDDLGPFAYGYAIDLIGNTRWLRREHPDDWSKVRYAGTLHNWLIRELSGRWVTSHTAGPVQDSWPEEASTLTGLPLDAFPEVVPDSSQIGTLTGRAAAELELPADTPIVTGTHDGAAANLGVGAIEPGDGCLTLGTNGVLRVVTGERLPRQFGYAITDRRWALIRDIPNLALHLDSIVKATRHGQGRVSPKRHRELSAIARDVPAGAGGLTLPILASRSVRETAEIAERALQAGHSTAALYRAGLEGTAFAFLGLVHHANVVDAQIDRYLVTGGAKENLLLLRILSATLNQPIAYSDQEEGLTGIACLAAVGADWYGSVEEAIEQMVHLNGTVVASEEETEIYNVLASSVAIPTGVAPGDHVAGTGRHD